MNDASCPFKDKLFMANKNLRFLLGIVSIVGFMYALPFLQREPNTQKILDHIEENDIDTRALFYTESEEAGEAVFWLNKELER